MSAARPPAADRVSPTVDGVSPDDLTLDGVASAAKEDAAGGYAMGDAWEAAEAADEFVDALGEEEFRPAADSGYHPAPPLPPPTPTSLPPLPTPPLNRSLEGSLSSPPPRGQPVAPRPLLPPGKVCVTSPLPVSPPRSGYHVPLPCPHPSLSTALHTAPSLSLSAACGSPPC